MSDDSELGAAEKLFLAIHNQRYDFLYQTESSPDKWLTVVKPEGLSYRDYILLDYQIIDVLFGGNAVIKSGFRNIKDVEYLSCGFGGGTRYFALDIDSGNNEYHDLETIKRILEVTKHIGKPVFMQSSYTRGWHLRWYFTEEIKTFNLAIYLRQLFTNNGFIIQGGKLEIYPNVKSDPKAKYQGLRLPCQKGSALLSLEDGRKIATWDEGPEIFLVHWADEVNKNQVNSQIITPLIGTDLKSLKSKTWEEEYLEIKENGFTANSQTNYMLGKMAKGLIVFESITDVNDLTKGLCKWLDEKNNGFSEEYNQSKELAYAWCKRWAICALKKYKPLNKMIKRKVSNNSKRALSAQYEHQLDKAFKDGLIKPEMSIRMIEHITGISKSVIQRKLNTMRVA